MRTIYHATSTPLASFAPRPAWFATERADADGWRRMGPPGGHLYLCEYAGPIASESEAAAYAAEGWESEAAIYPRAREFPRDKVLRFIETFPWPACEVVDYTPVLFETTARRSLSVWVKTASQVVVRSAVA